MSLALAVFCFFLCLCHCAMDYNPDLDQGRGRAVTATPPQGMCRKCFSGVFVLSLNQPMAATFAPKPINKHCAYWWALVEIQFLFTQKSAAD